MKIHKDVMTMLGSRRKFAIALSAAVVLALTACSGASPAAPNEADGIRKQTLVFAHITAETFPYHDGALKFKELLEEATDGTITVDVFPGGQLGQERDINESILEGSVHIGIAAGALATLAPIVNLNLLPFMIQDQQHMNRIIASKVGDQIAERISSEGGFHVVDYFSTGDSSIQSVGVAITHPSHMKGLKLRALENAALTDAMQTLGANPTPMPYGEIYTGVQSGVIEGATLDWNSVLSMRLYELIDHATAPSAAFLAYPCPVIMSNEFWESLNAAEQKVISEAMTEAADFQRKLFIEMKDEAVKEVIATGLTITEIDQEAFVEALRPVWNKWAKKLGAEDILDTILSLRE